MVDKLKVIIDKALTRRTFLAGVGGVAATTMVSGLTGCAGNNSSSSTPNVNYTKRRRSEFRT